MVRINAQIKNIPKFIKMNLLAGVGTVATKEKQLVLKINDS